MKTINLFLVAFIIQFQFIVGQNKNSENPAFQIQLKELEDIYTQWMHCTIQHGCDKGDILDEEFSTKFTKLILENPSSFYDELSVLSKNGIVQVYQSDDGKLRIYNWDKFSNSSMREYYSIYQFETKGNIETILGQVKNGKNQAFLDQIAALYTLEIEGKNYYFTIRNTILSSNDITQSIECLSLENGNLRREVPLFKTKVKSFGKISFNFLRASLYDPLEDFDNLRDAYNLIVFDARKKEIKIPVVDETLEVKKQYLVYKLKGLMFEYIGIQK